MPGAEAEGIAPAGAPTSAPPRAPKRLLLLGGGHAHLSLLKALATRPVPGWSVQLVTPFPRFIYSGMLPGWVAGEWSLDDCTISLPALAVRAHVALHETAAIALDLTLNEVVSADGRRRRFDLLSIDTGPQAALVGLPGAAEHALTVRPIERFMTAWPQVVERWRTSAARFELLVVGDGAAAVELAFSIRARARREGASQVRVSLLGGEALPLPGAAPPLRRQLLALLRKRGVHWHGDGIVTQVLAGSVVRERGAALAFDVCIAATGTAAPRWPGEAGLATDERGFIRVDRSLRSTSHAQVFAAGDVAAYADARPKSGVFAVRAGPVLADNLRAACAGQPLREWRPPQRALSLIGTGDQHAVAAWGRFSAGGHWAWRWKNHIDKRFVQSFSS